MHRIITIATLALLVLATAVTSAMAHVTANPREGTAGGFNKIDFRVPNEKDEATVKVTVQIPEGVTNVSVQPVPGWEYETKSGKYAEAVTVHGEKVTEGVTEITWSGGEIKAGEFMQFPVSVRLPDEADSDMVFFPALQEYEGGEVVKWIEKAEEGEDEPEMPAPAVTLMAAADDHGSAAMEEKGEDADDNNASAADDDKLKKAVDQIDDEFEMIRTMAYVGVVLGALALLLWVLGMMRARRTKD